MVAAAASLFLALLQALQQRLCRFARRGEVVDVLRLDRVYSATVFHVHEVNHVELAPFRHFAELLILLVVVIKFRGQRRELVVIDHHCESLGRMLSDKRLDNAECLTRSRCSDDPCSTETVGYIGPAFAEFAFVIVPHGNVHAVRGLYQFLALLEALVLEIETVFHQTVLGELWYVVQCNVYQYHTRKGSRHIENDVQRQGV